MNRINRKHFLKMVGSPGAVSLAFALVLAITLPREAQAASVPTLQQNCNYFTTMVADPIAHTTHSHEFYGNKAVHGDSTYEEMMGQETTCNIVSNTTSYWHPSFRDNGKVQTPTNITTYYRDPGTRSPAMIPYPDGAKILLSHDNGKVKYRCGKNSATSTPPVGCTTDWRVLFLFPFCWDKQGLETENFKYTSKACPSTHPQELPHLQMAAKYPRPTDGRLDAPVEISIGSGQWGLATEHAHADLFVASTDYFRDNWMEPCVTSVPAESSSPSRCQSPKPGTP